MTYTTCRVHSAKRINVSVHDNRRYCITVDKFSLLWIIMMCIKLIYSYTNHGLKFKICNLYVITYSMLREETAVYSTISFSCINSLIKSFICIESKKLMQEIGAIFAIRRCNICMNIKGVCGCVCACVCVRMCLAVKHESWKGRSQFVCLYTRYPHKCNNVRQLDKYGFTQKRIRVSLSACIWSEHYHSRPLESKKILVFFFLIDYIKNINLIY